MVSSHRHGVLMLGLTIYSEGTQSFSKHLRVKVAIFRDGTSVSSILEAKQIHFRKSSYPLRIIQDESCKGGQAISGNHCL